MSSVLETKGKQAQLCYEDLKKRTGTGILMIWISVLVTR